MSTRVVGGPRYVDEALDAGDVVKVVGDARARRDHAALIEKARTAGIPFEHVERGALDRLVGDARHRGIAAHVRAFVFTELDELLTADAPLLMALDEITDPHNFGAIVRSAVAFGADGILVPRHRSAAVTPVVVRASAGAIARARIAEVTNLQRTLLTLREERGFEIVGLDASGGTPLRDLGPAPLGRVLVIGSEGEGLRRLVRERCTVLASIPIATEVESLNASVAAAIALYELARQRA